MFVFNQKIWVSKIISNLRYGLKYIIMYYDMLHFWLIAYIFLKPKNYVKSNFFSGCSGRIATISTASHLHVTHSRVMQISHLSLMPQRQLVLALLTASVLLLLFLHGHSYAYPNLVVGYRKNPVGDAAIKPWLLLTISNADHLQRRQIIRGTWGTFVV